MKKLVLNISDCNYEKLRFEAIKSKKSIEDVLRDRIFFKDFDEEVQECYENWLDQEMQKILGE